jgi:hypothetical protein
MSWGSLSEAAGHAAVWALIADVAEEHKDEARAWLTAKMGPDAAAVKAIANGTHVGRVTWTEGTPKLAVVDERAFLAFVQEHYPTETLTIVNPAFKTMLLDKATQVDGTVIDSHGVPIAGVDYRTSKTYVTVNKSDDARATVDALLSSGKLQLGGLAEVTGGDPDHGGS